MIENQKMIEEKGMDMFLESQAEKYRCSSCGDIISVHDGKCYTCGYYAGACARANIKAQAPGLGGCQTENRLAAPRNPYLSAY